MEQNENGPKINDGRYAGRWLAIDPATRDIIAEGDTLEDARDRARSRGVANPLMHPVPRSDRSFIGIA
ncbi:MAG: hypothetical protein DWQ41_22170 [Planctomycetota bacterium]|nr:MAG: hypothetical protein DWQ41_22170 [Planctomycetota bacterium]